MPEGDAEDLDAKIAAELGLDDDDDDVLLPGDGEVLNADEDFERVLANDDDE